MAEHDPEQHIRERAHALWEKEGGPPGRDAEFWERAKLMVQAEAKPAMSTPLQERSPDEKVVDDAMKESFPASDPPSFTPEGGTVAAPVQARKGRK